MSQQIENTYTQDDDASDAWSDIESQDELDDELAPRGMFADMSNIVAYRLFKSLKDRRKTSRFQPTLNECINPFEMHLPLGEQGAQSRRTPVHLSPSAYFQLVTPDSSIASAIDPNAASNTCGGAAKQDEHLRIESRKRKREDDGEDCDVKDSDVQVDEADEGDVEEDNVNEDDVDQDKVDEDGVCEHDAEEINEDDVAETKEEEREQESDGERPDHADSEAREPPATVTRSRRRTKTRRIEASVGQPGTVASSSTSQNPNGRPFVCGICDRGFRRKADRNRHEKSHTAAVLTCQVCQETVCDRDDALRRHQLRAKHCVELQSKYSDANLRRLGCVTRADRAAWEAKMAAKAAQQNA